MKKIFGAVLLAALFVSCSSLQQDVVISSEQLVHQEDVVSIETILAKLDADAIMGVNIENRTRLCNALLTQIDEAFESSGMQKQLQSRLYALQGRVYLLMGRKNDARSCYDAALRSSKGDAQAAVLGSRLGLVAEVDSKTSLAQSNQKSLLVLEGGLKNYGEGNYLDALAKMDEAFISLDSFYKIAYQDVRNSAWSLRSVSASSNDAVLLKVVTVSDIAQIARLNTNVITAYAGSKELSSSELYSILSKAGFFSPVSAGTSDASLIPLPSDKASRILCARFLWNLYTTRKTNRKSATAYSSAYAQMGEASPVADVPVDSPDFDAVLGCVENELMDLPDGEHFFPDKTVSGVEFKTWVSKIK